MSKVTIIGAGITGLSAGYELAKKGHHIEIIDQGSPGDGCSYGNAGMLVPSHFITLPSPGVVAKALRWMTYATSPFSIRFSLRGSYLDFLWKFYRYSNKSHVERHMEYLLQLHLRSRDIFLGWRDELPPFGLSTKGITMLYNSEKGALEEKKMAEQANELGVSTKVYNNEQLRVLEPNLEINAMGGVHYELDAHLDPALLMATLREELKSRGAVFHDNTCVSSIDLKNERIEGIVSDKGTFTSDYFVMAAGAWSHHLMEPLGVYLPVEAGKGYSMDFPDKEHVFKVPKLINEDKVTVTPVGDMVRFGGTMQIGGHSSDISPAKIRGILNATSKYFPGFPLDEPVTPKPWVGFRPLSPDGLPYIGALKRYPNMIIATGHSMLGISLAAITGKLVSELVSGIEPSLSIEPMNPERLAAKKH